MIRNTTGTRTRTAKAKLTALVTVGVLGASLVALVPAASAAVPASATTTYTCRMTRSHR
nr:hypothetical protein OG999_49630 [Streptomyces sp. NBC_00886]